MKKIIVLALALAAFVLPRVAQASHHLVFISKIIRISDSSCAVELQMSGSSQNHFDANDSVRIGTTDALFGSAVTAINNHGNDTGEHILVASDDFSEHVLTADVSFGNQNCANFDADAVIGYYLGAGSDDCSGSSPCKIDEINSAAVAGVGIDNTAIIKASKGAVPTLQDLDGCSLTVANSNNSSNTATIGTGAACGAGGSTTGGNNDSGGCSLIR